MTMPAMPASIVHALLLDATGLPNLRKIGTRAEESGSQLGKTHNSRLGFVKVKSPGNVRPPPSLDHHYEAVRACIRLIVMIGCSRPPMLPGSLVLPSS